MADQTLVTCPNCDKPVRVPSEWLGKRAKCKGCGEPFKLAAPPPEPLDDSYGDGEDDGPGSMYDLADLGRGTPAAPTPPPPRVAAAPAAKAGKAAKASKPKAKPAKGKAAASSGVGMRTGLGVGALVVITLLRIGWGVYRRLPSSASTNDPSVAQNSTSGGSSDTAGRAAAPPSAPRPAAQATPPALAFSTIDGRRVGNATATLKSRGTQVRLVLPAGEHPAKSLPCVFVCPAGSNLLTGVAFGEGEREDFYPLLDRGVAVCFYSLDGTVADSENASEMQFATAMSSYAEAHGGVSNLQDAVETVLAGAPAVDPKRLGAMGHSSAGTVALASAAGDPRIHAVAAMAPEMDLPTRFGPEVMNELPAGAMAKLPYDLSALHWAAMPCPVFIVQAEDDENVPASESRRLEAKFPQRVTVKRLPSGGHGGAYEQGLEPSFDFLAGQLGGKPAAKAESAKAEPTKPAPAVAYAPPPAAAVPPAIPPVMPPAAAPPVVKPDKPAMAAEPAADPAGPRRTAGTLVKGASADLLTGDWPEGFKMTTGPASFRLLKKEVSPGRPKGSWMGVEGTIVPKARVRPARRVGLQSGGNGTYDLDFRTGALTLPEGATAREVDFMGGRAIAYEGSDFQNGTPMFEKVIAFEAGDSVVLMHFYLSLKYSNRRSEFSKAIQTWAIARPDGAVPAPYVVK